MGVLNQEELEAGGLGAALAGRGVAYNKAEKLRGLASTASLNNPLILPPWTLPAAWAISTAYATGNVVSANGFWWVCQGAGTSAASGTGPSNASTANVIVDGTVQWLLVGAPTTSADDALAPTVTRSTTVPSAPDNVAWGLAVSTSANIARLYGGYQATSPTDRYRVSTFDRSPSSLARSSGGRIAFWSDAAKVTLLAPTTTGSEGAFRISVDGRYLTPSAYFNAASTYTTIDWSARGGRKPRYYEVEGFSREGLFTSLQVIYTTANDLVWKPSTDSDIRAYWIGDSQSAGHGFAAYQPGGGMAQRVARLLGWNDLWNASIGGTGYIAVGTGGPFYTYGERVVEGLTRNPDIWVFYGSTNDNGQSSAAITAAALAAYQAIRAGGSTAPIIVLGVVPISAACATTEAAIQAAVTAFADPLGKTFFVPLSNALPYPIIIGSFNRPASVGASISTFALDINTTDNVHIMEAAHPKHSRLIAGFIRDQVLALM